VSTYSVVLLAAGIINLILGFFVYFKARERRINKIFLGVSVCVFSWIMDCFGATIVPDENSMLVWTRIFDVGLFFIPPVVFSFFLALIDDKEKINRKLLIFSYGTSSTVFLSWFPHFRLTFIKYPWGYFTKMGSVYYLLFVNTVCFLSYGLFLVYKKYLRTASKMEKNRIKFVFLGAFIAIVTGIVTFLPNLGVDVPPIGPVGNMVYVAIFGYAIVRYRLMDIEMAISNSLLFFLLIGFVFLFYTLSLGLLYRHFGYVVSSLVSAGLIVGILFLTPFRQKLRNLIENFVYHGKYDYQKMLRESTKSLVTILDLKQLLEYIVNTISDTVGVEKISLCLREVSRSGYCIKASCGLDQELLDSYGLKPNQGIIPWLKQSKTAFIKEEMERALPGKVFENLYGDLGKIGAEFILPLFYKDNLVGVLNLSNKQSGGIYNQTDIDILESLGAHAAVAIENARLHTEVITDELTELYQPKYFELRLREEIEKGKRYRHCLSLMMIEVDNFEEFERSYGQEEKNKLLKSIAGIVRENLRMGDIACRCEGKGFGIILPEISEEPGGNIRERLKKQIREMVEIGERLRRRVQEKELGVTVSIGITSFDGQNREMEREALIKQAKDALTQAKREGNTVRVFYDEKLRQEISSEVLEWIKETEETLVSGDIYVDLSKRTVQVNGKPVKLTPKAFDLLCLLMKKKGRVLNRSFITESIWGYEYFGTTRTVDSHIKSLRQTLGTEGKKIETIKGIGYKFVDEESVQ